MSTNQKGTALVGDGIDEEVLASTDSIFTPGSYGAGQKGLQQFYSPPALAKLVQRVVGPNVATLDLTAGDGSLLKDLTPPFSFGVEIDKDQVKNAEGGYHAIKGDIQHVYPLLKLGTDSWEAIVLNPPFGLMWEDPAIRDGRPTNSAVMTFIYGSRLLAEDGQMIFVCGRDRFYRQIADLPEAEGIYATVECDDLFEGTTLPCVIAFGIHPGNRSVDSNGIAKRQDIPLSMLDLVGDWVLEQRQEALGQYNYVATRTYSNHALPDAFKAMQAEYDKRVEKRLGTGSKREFDAQLVGGKVVQWLPSAFASLALRQTGDAYAFNGLNNQSVNYFVNNERLWHKLVGFMESGVVTVDPRLVTTVSDILEEVNKTICPLYHIKPQQRLGYLADIDHIRCTKSDPDRGFEEGEMYRLHTKTETVVTESERPVESKKNPGEWDIKTFLKQRKMLSVTIGHWHFYDSSTDDTDGSEDIQYLIDHFYLPDPGEVANKHPEEIAEWEDFCQVILDEFAENSLEWEKDNPQATPYTHRPFQKRDIARLGFKGSGLLSWEQGLGKTLGGALFSEAMVRRGAQDARLFIVPKDLIPQWQRELKRFLGKEATLIEPKKYDYWETDPETGERKKKRTNGVHGQAKEIADHLRKGGTGMYITYYEALSVVGTNRSKAMPPIVVEEREEQKLVKGTDRHGYYYLKLPEGKTEDDYDPYSGRDEEGNVLPQIPCKGPYDEALPKGQTARYGYIRPRFETILKQITSKEVCPECRSDIRNGWNGLFCEAEQDDGSTCGYAHFEVRVKPMASLLASAFKRGVVVMDEIQMIQGDTAKRSKCIRGMRAAHKLGMTGTPIKNFIAQAFWPLWWCLGNGSKRFGYTYKGGRTKFENDFSVIEWMIGKSRKRETRKALPEVTNLSMLWRLLASSIIRRRKEETGEKLVPKFYHHIKAPLGMRQTEQMAEWMKMLPHGFPKFFEEKYPDKNVVKAGMHELLAPLLGLNWKLEYATTLPNSDPDAEWPGTDDLSDWTPANLRAVELAMALAKNGRKVLVGSNLIPQGKWIADRLCEKGVKAAHIVDGDGKTADPTKRAERVYSFQTDDMQVFCASVNAIRLGHNLDAADAVILHGFDWSYDTMDQFIARVHRLTSKNPIDVYVILPKPEDGDTISTRKWFVLGQKGSAAELALDGRLIEKHEDEIDQAALIRDLIERGLTVTDDCVDEVTVEEAWEAIPMFEDYVVPEGLIPPQPELPGEPHIATLAAAWLYTEQRKAPPPPQYDTPIGPPSPFLTEDVVPDEFVLEQNAAELDALEEELQKIEEAAMVNETAEAVGAFLQAIAALPKTEIAETEAAQTASGAEPGAAPVATSEPPVEPEAVGAPPLAPGGANGNGDVMTALAEMQAKIAELEKKNAELEAKQAKAEEPEQMSLEIDVEQVA